MPAALCPPEWCSRRVARVVGAGLHGAGLLPVGLLRAGLRRARRAPERRRAAEEGAVVATADFWRPARRPRPRLLRRRPRKAGGRR